MSAVAVVRHPTASAFLARAGPWLLRAEAEHNLTLGVADRLAMGLDAGFGKPIYLATLEQDGSVVGCAFRTPPYPVVLTRLPAEGVVPLLDDLSGIYPELPGVLGPEAAAGAFVTAWTDRTGGAARLGMQQSIYTLETLHPPDPWPPGSLRVVRPGESEWIQEWVRAFHREVDLPARNDPPELVAGLAMAGDLFVWEEGGEARSMAAVAARTPHGARIGFVYTPPEQRGRGFGTAVSAAVTRRVLDRGARFCFLYADRANPTSNAIYKGLGYRHVCDVVDYRFDAVG